MAETSPPRTRRLSLVLLGLGVIVFAGIALLGVLRLAQKPEQDAGMPAACNNRAFAEIGGPFNLVNQDNRPVSNLTFRGKPMLIYFGFTYCPDICPLSLQTMRLALEEAQSVAGAKAAAIQPLLISIDPARDTPAALKTYVASNGFPAGLQGLTGTQAQVEAAAKAYKVGFRKSVTPGGQPQDYLMDHTSIFYLVDSQGKLASFFSADPDPKEMGQCIGALAKRGL